MDLAMNMVDIWNEVFTIDDVKCWSEILTILLFILLD